MIDAMIDALGQIAAPSRSVEIDPSRPPYHDHALVDTALWPMDAARRCLMCLRPIWVGVATG
jgi:hypothetical protein